MWQILRRNPRTLGAALLLHLILAVLTLVGVDWWANSNKVSAKPRVVQATIVDPKAMEAEIEARHQAEETAKLKAEKEARRRAEEAVKRKAEEAARRQAEEAAKRKAEEAARRQAEEAAKRKAEEAARRQAEEAAKRKAATEAKRRAEAEARRQAEAKLKAEKEAGARRAREQDLQAALDAEQADSELSLYTSAIQERVRRTWVRQLGMGRDLSCLVEVRLIPGGEVAPDGVRVIRSSGNPAFDQSVVIAVYKASPLPVPSGRSFERFRNLRLEFRP